MQIPLLSGITTNATADFRTSYPVNLVPVPKDTGISKGYLRTASGLTQFATGPGVDRGGIQVFTSCFRVMGSELVIVRENGDVDIVGNVGGGGRVSMDYSSDRLCIVSDGSAYYAGSDSVTPITDPDIGTPIDVVWVDGYFMFTDGNFIYVTELNDPFSIDPTKYAASEIDPDYVTGLLKYRNEIYVFNRNTIEVFDDTGGSGFPFSRVSGGLIPKGCVGTHAKCLFAETFAWLGSARNEANSVYVASGGSAVKIATREVEERIAAYTEEELTDVLVEAKADRLHQHLYVHLPNETLVYDATASLVAGQPVWFFISTGVSGIHPYRAQNFVYAYGKWIVGDTQDGRIGFVDETVMSQYGEVTGWTFETPLIYNQSKGGIVNSLELVGTTGRAPFGEDPSVFHSYTLDGLTWSDERQAGLGTAGQTQKRVVWRSDGKFDNFRGERFRGANTCPISWARLEAEIEPLNA